MKTLAPRSLVDSFASLVSDLLRGGRHSRTTTARAFGVSLATADRWLVALLVIPGMRRRRVSKTTWIEWDAPAWAARTEHAR